MEETGIVRHLFSTRLGGVSGDEFASMNFSVDRGDRKENVMKNYGRIAEVLGCSVGDMTASHQTHTTNIRRMGPEDRGKGITFARDYENVDGLLTDDGAGRGTPPRWEQQFLIIGQRGEKSKGIFEGGFIPPPLD